MAWAAAWPETPLPAPRLPQLARAGMPLSFAWVADLVQIAAGRRFALICFQTSASANSCSRTAVEIRCRRAARSAALSRSLTVRPSRAFVPVPVSSFHVIPIPTRLPQHIESGGGQSRIHHSEIRRAPAASGPDLPKLALFRSQSPFPLPSGGVSRAAGRLTHPPLGGSSGRFTCTLGSESA